ncbi:MAG: hypothetical protein WDM91_11215 [Rhizomicrobium sp.]
MTIPIHEGPAMTPTDEVVTILRPFLRELVDHVWNVANEDESVPATDWADRMIDEVVRICPLPLEAITAASLPGGEEFNRTLRCLICHEGVSWHCDKCGTRAVNEDELLATLQAEYRRPTAAGIVPDASFLLDRLAHFEGNKDLSDHDMREWNGHITPAIARLRSAIAAAPSPVAPTTQVGVDALLDAARAEERKRLAKLLEERASQLPGGIERAGFFLSAITVRRGRLLTNAEQIANLRAAISDEPAPHPAPGYLEAEDDPTPFPGHDVTFPGEDFPDDGLGLGCSICNMRGAALSRPCKPALSRAEEA